MVHATETGVSPGCVGSLWFVYDFTFLLLLQTTKDVTPADDDDDEEEDDEEAVDMEG